MTVKKPKKVAGHKALQIAGDSESAMNKIRLPYLLLESAATEESPDQGLDEDCWLLLVLLSSPFLPGLPGFVQELGLGALRYTKHCAPWKIIIEQTFHTPIRVIVLIVATNRISFYKEGHYDYVASQQPHIGSIWV